MPVPYSINPQPRAGQGTYGRVPGVIGLPNPAADLRTQAPGLGRTNSAIMGDIYAGASGQLAPGTVKDLQDFNAEWSTGAGLPYNSGLGRNRLGRNIGRSAQDLIAQSIAQYNQTIPTISGTQTVNPALQYEIANQNALNSAAPDPTAAQSHAEALFREYQNRLAQGGGGGGGISRGGGPGGGTMPNPTAGEGGPNEVVGRSTGTGTVINGRVVYPGEGGGGSDFYGAGSGQAMNDQEWADYMLANDPYQNYDPGTMNSAYEGAG